MSVLSEMWLTWDSDNNPPSRAVLHIPLGAFPALTERPSHPNWVEVGGVCFDLSCLDCAERISS